MPTDATGHGGLEIRDLRARPDEQFLQDVYTTLYLTNFTIPSEQEDPSIWRPRLWGAEPQPLELHVLVAGTALDQPERRQLYGMNFCELYLASACGLITYLAVPAAFRGRGLARRLVAEGVALLRDRARALALAPRGELRAMFSEANDPTKVAEDVMDPWERLRAFGRMGARIVPIAYVQPELIPGRGPCRDLLLLAWPIAGPRIDSLSAGTLRDFLADFYQISGVDVPASDPDFQQMSATLDRLTHGGSGDELALIPVEEWLRTRQAGRA